jgi:hypothetical protein
MRIAYGTIEKVCTRYTFVATANMFSSSYYPELGHPGTNLFKLID